MARKMEKLLEMQMNIPKINLVKKKFYFPQQKVDDLSTLPSVIFLTVFLFCLNSRDLK